MKVIISIGGSILAPAGVDVESLKNFTKAISDILKNKDIKMGIVIGGGKTARNYISAARASGASEFYCDLVGIDVTRINARILISALGELAHPEVPHDVVSASEIISNTGKVMVMGGTHPGHTTDAVSAMLAENVGADLLVIATSTDYVYDSDPHLNKDAKRIEKLSYDRLIEITGMCEMSAGSSTVVDLLASKIIKRSKIKTIVLDGRDGENMKSAVLGGDFKGSVISGDYL